MADHERINRLLDLNPDTGVEALTFANLLNSAGQDAALAYADSCGEEARLEVIRLGAAMAEAAFFEYPED